KTGTALDVARIAAVCRQAHRRGSPLGRVARIGAVTLATALALAIAVAAIPAARGLEPILPRLATCAAFWFAGALALFGGAFLALVARRNPALFGLRLPAGGDAWLALPPALFGASLGGVWIPAIPVPAAGAPASAWAALLAFPLLPIGAEILFRGMVHGSLAWAFRIQRAGGPWLLSWPALLSAVLFAPWAGLLAAASAVDLPTGGGVWEAPFWGALPSGAAAAVARERSESLLLPILLHGLGVPVALLARSFA